MMLYEVRVLRNPLAQIIEERGLQSREAVVHPRYMRLSKLVSLRIALARKAVYDRSSRVSQSHDLGTFVYRLPCCIVYRLAEYLHVVISIHLDNLRIAAADEKTQERERRLTVIIVVLLDKMSHDMSLQMIDIYERYAKGAGHAFREVHSYEQRTHKTRATGESYGRELFLPYSRTLERGIDDRDDILLVGTGCQFRHDTAVFLMDGLRSRHVAQQHTVAQHRCRCIITRRLYR